MQRFYIVWNPAGTRPPKFRHGAYALAMDEARRLARENPGSEFIVLAALSSAKVRDPVDVSHFDGRLTLPSGTDLDDGIPF